MFSFHSVDFLLYEYSEEVTSEIIGTVYDSSGIRTTFDHNYYSEYAQIIHNTHGYTSKYTRLQDFFLDGSSRAGQNITNDYSVSWTSVGSFATSLDTQIKASFTTSYVESFRQDGTILSSYTTMGTSWRGANYITAVERPIQLSLQKTQTYGFTTTFTILNNISPPSTISATGSGTTTNTDLTLPTFLVTTTAYAFCGDMAAAEIWTNMRFNPPPLRQVAGHFHAPSFSAPVQSGVYYDQAIPIGIDTLAWAKTLRSISYSSKITDTVISDITDNSVYSKLWTTSKVTSFVPTVTLTYCSITSLSPVVEAVRQSLASAGYMTAGATGGIYSSYNASPEGITNIPDFFVEVLNSVFTPRIFTTTQGGFSIDDSNALGQWILTNGNWSLRLTKLNETTSSSLFATISITGSNSLITVNALAGAGNTGGLLGPAYPLLDSGLNVYSISFYEADMGINSLASTYPFFLYTGRPTTGNYTEDSVFFLSSGENQFTIGSSSSGRRLISYDQSRLTFYKGIGGSSYSISTVSFDGFNQSVPIVTLNSMALHLKYNELGTMDDNFGLAGASR